jgi:N-acetylmuramoyl-L-alanine amidase
MNRTTQALGWGAAALVLLLLPEHAARHSSPSWADTQFAAASQLQQALEGRPAADRTRRDYERVISAYHRVYTGAPSSSKADPSVVAAAQMTEEMGRRFNDSEVLRSAIQQYEFLRREYPGSKFRFNALYRIGEIYKDDLHDKARADETFAEFLRRYPHNQFAGNARAALAEPVQQPAALVVKDSGKTKLTPKTAKDVPATAKDEDDSEDDANTSDSPQGAAATPEAASPKAARVLGIRHWSTPDYTRVAIDLEQSVKYESQRLDNPDRIFFDLLNTKLDRKLAGKSFDVADGLLKDVRVAQYKAGRTRIVLDLDGGSEFNA